MKILVTGSTGFVGEHTCRQLVKDGHEVYALCRSVKKFKEKEIPGHPIVGNLSDFTWTGSLPQDLDSVIHIAGLVHSHDVKKFYEVNAEGTLGLINALSSYEKLNFTLVSSLAAVGPADVHFQSPSEKLSEKPVSEYGKSKLMAESYLKFRAPKKWTKTIVRPPMVIGPGDPAVLEVFQFLNKGLRIYIGQKGDQKKYSFVCVFDLVNTIVSCLKINDGKIHTYFSSFPDEISMELLNNEIRGHMSGKDITVKLPEWLVKASGNLNSFMAKYANIETRLTKDKLNELLPKAWTCDSQKSVQELGIQYQWDLSKTIKATYDDYKSRGWL